MSNLKPLNNIQVKDRICYAFIERAKIKVKDGGLYIIKEDVRYFLPIANISVLFLMPGVSITHEAIKLLSRTNTMILYIGKDYNRLYSYGSSFYLKNKRLIKQALLVNDKAERLKIARKMFEMRFEERFPQRRSIAQLVSLEGRRVKEQYKILARQHGIQWNGRIYSGENVNTINKAITIANTCLYGICECAIITCGYSPCLGFIHNGNKLSFVYDISDLYKFKYILPIVFNIVKHNNENIDFLIRKKCGEFFMKKRFISKIIKDIYSIIDEDSVVIENIIPTTHEDKL